MVFSGNNLPSLKGQRDHILVQNITHNIKPHEHISCNESETLAQYKYRGFSMSALHTQGNTFIKAVYHNYGIYKNSDDKYVVQFIDSEIGYISFVPLPHSRPALTQKTLQKLQRAIYYAFNPLERSGVIYRLLTLNSNIDPHVLMSDIEIETAKLMTYTMLARYENSFNSIDTAHVPVHIHGATVKSASNNLHAYINNTYINVVHDCNVVCSQSLLSNSQYPMSLYETELQSMLCVHRILEISGSIQDTTTSVRTTTKRTTDTTTTTTTEEVTTHIKIRNTTHVTTLSTHTFPVSTTAVYTGTYVHIQCAACGACVVSIWPIAVSIVIATLSATAIFISYSGSKCAKSIRTCLLKYRGRILNTRERIETFARNINATRAQTIETTEKARVSVSSDKEDTSSQDNEPQDIEVV